MPYLPQKSECYENLGGINRKLSTYLTGPQEFLNLQNIDFRTTGSLSSFCGYAQSVIGSISAIITGVADFTSSSQVIYFMATGATQLYNCSGATFNPVFNLLIFNNTQFSFLKSSVLYGANGYDFFKYPGITDNIGQQYSLPSPYLPSVAIGTRGASGLIGASFIVYWAFNRYDGTIGPILSIDYSSILSLVGHSVSSVIVGVPTLLATAFPGVSFGGFGITSFSVWYSLNGSDPRKGATPISLGTITYAISDDFVGFTSLEFDDYFGSFLYGESRGASGGTIFPQNNPTTIEQYANALFAAGFALSPDTIWYSRPGEFEKHDLDGFIDFRANDGDKITCIKNYFTQLAIFKTNSIGALTGTDANTFTLTEVNTQYGNISPTSVCVFNQRMWFLDKKGICEYNGANTRIVSDRMEHIFLRMNIFSALIYATMVHVKERNEVWCAIPIDGSPTNNIIVVYDYLADAWTTRTIDSLTYLTNSTQNVGKQITYFGSSNGIINAFGNSHTTDAGTKFTSIIQTRFCHDMGHSVEKMFRRLYVDASIPAGTTQTININFYTNQGSSPSLSMTMQISEFQKRLDFGLSAKDMSVEFIYSEGSFLKINGYTIEYRFQRAT